MSIFSSVIGSLSPKFRSSFEDPHEREHELPLYNSPPRIPPPVASTVLWSPQSHSVSPPPKVPDELLALQRRARHLEQQLQELLDAQADGLMSGLTGNNPTADDLVSNGSTTPTVSSIQQHARELERGEHGHVSRKKVVGLNVARRGIARRIQQLAHVKAEEKRILDEDLREMESVLEMTQRWGQKRSRLQKRIQEIESENFGERTKALQDEASRLEQEIRLKEEELWALKARHRRTLTELADSENSISAKLSSYKESLSILDKEVASFLTRPPDPRHVQQSSPPFLSLPPRRRTLDMALDYWQDERSLLAEHCEEVDKDRAALDEGVGLWNDVVNKILEFETTLQDQMQQGAADPSKLLAQMEDTAAYVEEKLELATSKHWNLLMCAIGAELEAFRQGKEILEQALGIKRKGKEKVSNLVDTESSSHTESEEEASSVASKSSRSPSKSPTALNPRFFDRDDEDPDPELLISHHDTDTD